MATIELQSGRFEPARRFKHCPFNPDSSRDTNVSSEALAKDDSTTYKSKQKNLRPFQI
jgi:hypothetical protein